MFLYKPDIRKNPIESDFEGLTIVCLLMTCDHAMKISFLMQLQKNGVFYQK